MAVLCDETILQKEAFCKNGTFNKDNVKGGCYEATISSDSYFVIDDIEKRADSVSVNEGDSIILSPGCQIVIKTKEFFSIPKDHLAMVILKGTYVTLGIAPVSTIAEPGFSGRLGIILNNTSKQYVKFVPGEVFVKLVFHSLDKECNNGYQEHHSGQQPTWPFRGDFVASEQELKANKVIENDEKEILKIYGPLLANTIKDVKTTKYTFVFTLCLSLVASILVLSNFSGEKLFDIKYAFVTIATSLLSTIVVNILCAVFIPIIERKYRK